MLRETNNNNNNNNNSQFVFVFTVMKATTAAATAATTNEAMNPANEADRLRNVSTKIERRTVGRTGHSFGKKERG
jgi:hypothetical protein